MAIGMSVFALLACLPGSPSHAGSCNLQMDCDANDSCAQTIIQLDWTDEGADTLHLDGREVPIIRLDRPTVLDTIRAAGTDRKIRVEGPAILVSGNHLSGVLKPVGSEGNVVLSIRDMPRRYADYPQLPRLYDGRCEGLF